MKPDLGGLMEVLGLDEEPMGMVYTDEDPGGAFSPRPQQLPSVDMEKRGEVDWNAIFVNFSCVIGNIWRARKKKGAAVFEREKFGCLGGAFYLGFLKPQFDFIAHYISTGIPGVVEGEHYLESSQVSHDFFQTIDPRPAPARFCVFKPLGQFQENEKPELIIFFARPEVISGLHQLVTFVTNDVEAVVSPFGAGCSNIVTWPLHYLAQGQFKAVLGGWDPSARKYFKTDEITLTIPYEMYLRMASRWTESFLTTGTWKTVQKKIARSRKAWGEAQGKGD